MSELSEMADLLFGGGADELIAKMNPAQSDLAAADQHKRKVTAGLNAVGAAAGAAGLGLATHNLKRSYRFARTAQKAEHAFHAPGARKAAVKAALGKEKFATGLIPLEVAGLGGELSATKILHNDSKKSKLKPVKKDLGDVKVPTKRGVLKAAATDPRVQAKGKELTKKGVITLKKLPDQVKKSDEVEVVWDAEIAKADADKQQVFGWASVVNVNGEPVVDLQGDYISPDEMEKAAYTYVMKSRKGGDMHQRDGLEPIQKSAMIESFIVTDEKKQAMGLPDTVPTGWWVGFQVQDPDLWADVKTGKRTGFSIHGHGRRTASP